jgi:hypothetical protein
VISILLTPTLYNAVCVPEKAAAELKHITPDKMNRMKR